MTLTYKHKTSTPFDDAQTGSSTLTQLDLFGTATGTAYGLATSVIHQDVRTLLEDSHALKRRGSLAALSDLTEQALRDGSVTLLLEARNYGFSWRDVARVIGVSVPALQKWRKGEGMTSSNLRALAQFVALVRLLRDEHLYTDPSSWLEMPVSDTVHLSKLDMLAAGGYDLVLELASDRPDGAELESLLSEFDAEWRTKYVDDTFEVFVSSDGAPSIRPKA